jgi:hypothetical protein
LQNRVRELEAHASEDRIMISHLFSALAAGVKFLAARPNSSLPPLLMQKIMDVLEYDRMQSSKQEGAPSVTPYLPQSAQPARRPQSVLSEKPEGDDE